MAYLASRVLLASSDDFLFDLSSSDDSGMPSSIAFKIWSTFCSISVRISSSWSLLAERECDLLMLVVSN